jgi:hypothetical protein
METFPQEAQALKKTFLKDGINFFFSSELFSTQKL